MEEAQKPGTNAYCLHRIELSVSTILISPLLIAPIAEVNFTMTAYKETTYTSLDVRVIPYLMPKHLYETAFYLDLTKSSEIAMQTCEELTILNSQKLVHLDR